MTQDIPQATHRGDLKIGDVDIPCFVLEDGRRVISGRTLTSAIGMKGRGQGVARISQYKSLKPFYNNDLLLAIENPIQFSWHTPRGDDGTFGYEAHVLQELCESILTARESGALSTEHEIRYAQHAEMLIRAFARVGIIALIDEATGYQEQREKNALSQILNRYLNDYASRWSKTFPDEFWIKLIRVKGYPSYIALNRPSYVGHWVNDIVYDRLAPGIKEKLKGLNPRDRSGNRTHKHHQFLTQDEGVPELKEHLVKVMALMDASSDNEQFMKLLNRAYPKFGSTGQLDI
ncbi:IS1595 family transposase ISRhba1 [Halomonadaceae bacterium LMG 33818]|uniref:P63C domain-containing protein n=1 Tax=Cernens ardua TaxID=3402176 RepID=UPI003EDC0D55